MQEGRPLLGEQGGGWGTGRDSQEWKGTLQGGVGGGGTGKTEGHGAWRGQEGVAHP